MMTSKSAAPKNPTNTFGYANVGTYGLGHSLLAWARCHLWCEENKVPMIAPSWLHIQHRIGPILRGERDNRQYHRLFQFPDYITGLYRQYLLATLKRFDIDSLNEKESLSSTLPKMVVFTNKLNLNEETYFPQLVGNGRKLRMALLAMTKPRYHPIPNPQPHIALHVRMGDFGVPDSVESLRSGAKNSRIPLYWYCEMLKGIRNNFGNTPAVVYSDGSDEELYQLLKLENVTRPPKQSSISDMLGIAQAKLIISSGSGFSAWGTFLADSPRICFPGQRFVRVLGAPKNSEFDPEPECEYSSHLNSAFLLHMSKQLNCT